MSDAADTIRLALAALLTGAALPLLVQLFLATRSLRRAGETAERRLDEALREIRELTADVRRGAAAASTGSSSLPAILAAATPAVIAAVRAFRQTMHPHTAHPAEVHVADGPGAAKFDDVKNGTSHKEQRP
jgi:hypothetical protein